MDLNSQSEPAGGGEKPKSTEMLETEMETARVQLRRRWELASVLNFFQVFEPVVNGSKMKISAEEIETALITPNGFLAQLHLTLLKGIPPVSKSMDAPDAWVTVLCKKLTMWWSWVAEGDIPIAVAKGEEIPRYKELDPITRLLLLKALCEVRAEQHDIIAYINDALKNGSEVSTFRKDMIGGDGIGVAYWLDGNALIGHRLYKEVRKIESKPISKGKKNLPSIAYNWETLATNLDEFCKVVDEFSSSGSKVEVAVSKTIETDVIPILNKLQKKKERALKQQQRQEMLLDGFRNCGIYRSCRSRTPVTYTFDAYDKVIDEAIQISKKRKISKEPTKVNKQGGKETNKINQNKVSDSETDSGKSSVDMQEHTETDSAKENSDSSVESETDSKEDDAYSEDDSNSSGSEIAKNEVGNKKRRDLNIPKQIHRHFGSRWSSRLAGNANHSVSENKEIVAKNRSRQRPIRNSAIESIVCDSEDEQLSNSEESQ